MFIIHWRKSWHFSNVHGQEQEQEQEIFTVWFYIPLAVQLVWLPLHLLPPPLGRFQKCFRKAKAQAFSYPLFPRLELLPSKYTQSARCAFKLSSFLHSKIIKVCQSAQCLHSCPSFICDSRPNCRTFRYHHLQAGELRPDPFTRFKLSTRSHWRSIENS